MIDIVIYIQAHFLINNESLWSYSYYVLIFWEQFYSTVIGASYEAATRRSQFLICKKLELDSMSSKIFFNFHK